MITDFFVNRTYSFQSQNNNIPWYFGRYYLELKDGKPRKCLQSLKFDDDKLVGVELEGFNGNILIVSIEHLKCFVCNSGGLIQEEMEL